MKKHRKKVILLAGLAVLIIYGVLLMILYHAEMAHPEAGISSLGDAVWYSLVTLTTVGYGDITPTTLVGRTVGMIFLLLSTGMLVTLFGTAVSFVTGEGIQLLTFWYRRERPWYYFTDYSHMTEALAADIYREEPRSLIIYGVPKEEAEIEPNYPCFFSQTSPLRLIAMKQPKDGPFRVFLLGMNSVGTYPHLEALLNAGAEVYASTANGSDSLPRMHFFHPYTCCGREYWQSNPILPSEKKIVILGFGAYGRQVLETAILTNIYAPKQEVQYHVFGGPEMDQYLNLHPGLKDVMGINEYREGCDSILFHWNHWTDHRALLQEADRIIICTDPMEKGWEDFWLVKRYYRTTGRIFLRNDKPAEGVDCFGTDEQIYSMKQVLRSELNRAAIRINDLFRRSVPYPTLIWSDLDDLHKEIKINAADHLLTKVRILLPEEDIRELNTDILARAYRVYEEDCRDEAKKEYYRRIDHNRWLRFYAYFNWTQGPKRDDDRMEHPLYLPYDEMPEYGRRERDLSWKLLKELAEEW